MQFPRLASVRPMLAVLPFLGLAALAACGGSSSSVPPTSARPGIWVAAWAQATRPQTAVTVSDETLRTIVKPSVGSRGTVRLHFTNEAGTAPLTLGAVHVGIRAAGSALVPGTDVALTFGGARTVTIPAGGTALSDAAPLQFAYGAVLAVSEYVAGSPGTLTGYTPDGGKVTSYYAPAGSGDQTGDVAGTSFSGTFTYALLVDRVDVLGNYTKTVAAIGSSTTAGGGSDLNAFDTYPEDLAADLHAAGRDDIAVVNVAFGPDSLQSAVPYGSNPPIQTRLGHDVLALPGIGTVIQSGGDIEIKASCLPATSAIDGERSVIAQAHAAGVRVLIATIPPSTFCGASNPGGYGTRFPQGSGQDAERQAFNAWVTSTAPSVVDGQPVQPPGADGALDLSAPVTDPSNTAYMLPQYDSGDDNHPNGAGYALEAKAIPLGAL